LKERLIIQKILASWLLVLFTISFIPKSYFHDLLADHNDVISCEHPGKDETCIHPKGINCSFNDLVVTAPYVTVSTAWNDLLPTIFTENKYSYIQPFLEVCYLAAESRGPPSIV
jgi:hypothetical protein